MGGKDGGKRADALAEGGFEKEGYERARGGSWSGGGGGGVRARGKGWQRGGRHDRTFTASCISQERHAELNSCLLPQTS